MATLPNLIIQKIASGSTVGGVLPSVSEVVTGEALTPTPAFNGALTSFTTQLAKFPIVPGTLVITTAVTNTEVFTDNGDGTLTGDAGGSGTIDYETGAVALTYFAAPDGADTIVGDYKTGSLESGVDRQLRGRIWRWKTQGDGGLFETPGRLVEQLLRERKVPTKGIQGEFGVRADELGFTLRRVYFEGAGTTAVVGVLRDPWGVLTTIVSEAVVLKPVPDGSHKSFTDGLVNGNVLPGSVVLTFSSGETLNDIAGDGLLRLDDSGAVKGIINYATGVIRLVFKTGPATGTTVAADYQYGSGSVDYEFLDTAKSHSVGAGVSLDPASFTWSPPPSGGGEMLVPPGWQVRFTSAGDLSGACSIGILCGTGMAYLPGQQLPGFGVTG